MGHPRCLCREEHLIPYSKDRQYGYSKEHDSQTTYPMRETTPKQNAMRKRFDIIQNRSTGGGKSRYNFKKSIRHRRYRPANKKRKHAESGKQNPRKRHDAISVPSCQFILCFPSQENQKPSSPHCYQGRINKINIIRLMIK